MFGLLRDKLGQEFDSFISKKVTAIAGDVSVQNLGLKDQNLNLFQEINLIVNFAATTKFDERL